jgi:hypothetical protein
LTRLRFSGVMLAIMLAGAGCGQSFAPSDLMATGVGDVQRTIEAASTSTPKAQPITPDSQTSEQELIRQWAVTAIASSQYSSPDWSAAQATGPPDTYPHCGDYRTAWASLDPHGVDWLEVRFVQPVIPRQVNIYETFAPGAVMQIDLRDVQGRQNTVWNGRPQSAGACPRVFSVEIGTSFRTNVVILHLDQSDHPSWDQIDAVELVGALR